MKVIQVSLATKNKDKLKVFYEKTFGFRESGSWENPKIGMRAVKIKKNNLVLEIAEAKDLVEDSRRFSYKNKGWNLIGIEVDNIFKVLKQVRKNGGKLVEGPNQGKTVRYLAYIEDIDGNGIELIEPKLRNKQSYKIKIEDYDRDFLWSSGIIAPDVGVLIEAAKENFWQAQIEKPEIIKGLKKIGDIAGCPIPDLVAERDSSAAAIIYLVSLVEDYNFIKNFLIQENIAWKNEWGEEEIKNAEEPYGEFASRIPPGIRERKIVRGPGNYSEFSITRLSWIDRTERDLDVQIGKNMLKDLIFSAKSIEDLQVNLIKEMADRRLNAGREMDRLVDKISKGICHEGFFKQNNPYKKVKSVLELLEASCRDKSWFMPLKNEVMWVLSLPLTPFS